MIIRLLMKTLKHKFVDNIPEKIEEGVLYVSIPYETAIHKCCCGCGNEVVTPISPTDWILTFNGQSITLSPSIGSWSLKCKSHYFIRENKVVWSTSFSEEKIKKVRRDDNADKRKYFEKEDSVDQLTSNKATKKADKKDSLLRRLISKIFSK